MNKNLAFLLFAAGGSAFGFFLARSMIEPEIEPAGEPKVVEPLDAQLQKKENELMREELEQIKAHLNLQTKK